MVKIINRKSKLKLEYYVLYSSVVLVNLALMALIIAASIITYSIDEILGINNISTIEYVLVSMMLIFFGIAVFYKVFSYYLLIMNIWFSRLNQIKNKLNGRKNNRQDKKVNF